MPHDYRYQYGMSPTRKSYVGRARYSPTGRGSYHPERANIPQADLEAVVADAMSNPDGSTVWNAAVHLLNQRFGPLSAAEASHLLRPVYDEMVPVSPRRSRSRSPRRYY
jgi:hypothetical protein